MNDVIIEPVEMITGRIGYYIRFCGMPHFSLTYDEQVAQERAEEFKEFIEIARNAVPDWDSFTTDVKLHIYYEVKEKSNEPCRHEAWVQGLDSCPSC